jgi:hypothetical protein
MEVLDMYSYYENTNNPNADLEQRRSRPSYPQEWLNGYYYGYKIGYKDGINKEINDPNYCLHENPYHSYCERPEYLP